MVAVDGVSAVGIGIVGRKSKRLTVDLDADSDGSLDEGCVGGEAFAQGEGGDDEAFTQDEKSIDNGEERMEMDEGQMMLRNESRMRVYEEMNNSPLLEGGGRIRLYEEIWSIMLSLMRNWMDSRGKIDALPDKAYFEAKFARGVDRP
ncbi:MAG: hypothetical protein Q9187_000909 [Circinaria calcarea]